MLADGARHRAVAARHQHAGDGRADPAGANCASGRSPVRAIIVSAYGDMANIRTAMNRGAFDFVTKPVDLDDLEITIRKTLDDIARVRETRASPRRRRAGAQQPGAVFLAQPRRDACRTGRAARAPCAAQTVAVLFVDIVGFTRMAEAMPPEAVVAMLRQFHERMTAQIFACGGTIEKYIGDAIFAVFGLPTSERGGRRATRSAAPTGCWQRSIAGTPNEVGRRAAAGHRHRPQLRTGGARRRRQRAQPFLHRDRRHGQHRHRLQVLTRRLQSSLVIADALVARLEGRGTEEVETLLSQLRDRGDHMLRGRSTPVRIWTKAE